MPVVVYSVLRLALLAVSWLLLTWAGLHPLAALLVAAFVAWGLSYAALGGPRDAAARYLADRAAERAAHPGRPVLPARAQEDAEVEDAAVDAALGAGSGGETLPTEGPADDTAVEPTDTPVDDTAAQPSDGPDSAQSASASPSSMP